MELKVDLYMVGCLGQGFLAQQMRKQVLTTSILFQAMRNSLEVSCKFERYAGTQDMAGQRHQLLLVHNNPQS